MKSKTEIDCMSAEAVREELKKLAAGDVKVSKSPIAPTIADPPSISSLKTPAKIEALQKYINSFKATMLAIYLTRDIANLSRVPLRFASSVHGHIYWHIVLALRGKCGRWGALGLSRRPDLGFKPLKFSTLPALVKSYKEAYEGIGHKIVKVTVGLPVGTKVESHEKVYWQFMSIPVSKAKWPDVEAVMRRYSKTMERYAKQVRGTGIYNTLENTVKCRCLELGHPGLLFKPPPEETECDADTQQQQHQGTEGNKKIDEPRRNLPSKDSSDRPHDRSTSCTKNSETPAVGTPKEARSSVPAAPTTSGGGAKSRENSNAAK